MTSRGGIDRVDGFLAVSRALGDIGLAPHVSCEPFVSCTKLTSTDDFLILACDGIWDVMSDDDAASIVSESVSDANVAAACERLRDTALERGSRDNISVMVIDVRCGDSASRYRHLLSSRS